MPGTLRTPIALLFALCSLSFAAEGQGKKNKLPETGTFMFRAILDSPGGPLPFGVEIKKSSAGAQAVLINAQERIAVADALLDDFNLLLSFPHYASEIRCAQTSSGVWKGRWRKRSPGGESTLEVTLTLVAPDAQGHIERFPVAAGYEDQDLIEDEDENIDGEWKVTFHGGDAPTPAGARFRAKSSRVAGTFLTPTGDYRYLEGDLRYRRLRLSCFDGAHAFLFTADLDDEGRLTGDFWSRDSWHETWTAERLSPGKTLGDVLPDPFTMTSLKPGKELAFRFPDLEGRPVSLDDARFRDRPVIVEIFGSWCPNCHDAAPVLRKLEERYSSQGLEIIGLAYEITGDPALDALQLRIYAEKYGCDWTLLLAGTSAKDGASSTLPSLTGVKSYPTTLFLDRQKKVRGIYTGFSGPATGPDHQKLLDEWDRLAAEIVGGDR